MALAPDSPLGRLMTQPMRPGELTWIGLRPERKAVMLAPDSAELVAEQGIVGDRYRTNRNGGRQVTLIAAEDLAALSSIQGLAVAPGLVRRNLVTRGVNLLALKDRRFRVGETLLEYAGECHPCSQMETYLGVGGYNAMRGRGGICARIVEGGTVRIGDVVVRAD
jgi:MOSC domain-containing protein YiiM